MGQPNFSTTLTDPALLAHLFMARRFIDKQNSEYVNRLIDPDKTEFPFKPLWLIEAENLWNNYMTIPNYNPETTDPEIVSLINGKHNQEQVFGNINGADTGGDGGGDTNKIPSSEYGKAIGLGALIFTNAIKTFSPVELNQAYNSTMSVAKEIASVNPYASAAVTLLDASNNLFGSKVDKYTVNLDLASRQRSSYGLTYNFMDKASEKSGTKVGWLSGIFGGGTAATRRKNIGIAKMNEQNIAAIDNKAQDYRDLAQDPNAEERYKSKILGYSEPLALSAKEGGVLSFDGFVYKEYIIDVNNWEYSEYDVTKFQKGGSFNVIPEGALHARKHNIELDDITKKGIPVVSEEDGGIVQHAEIERNEIIFRLEVTQKLEELSKKNTDESAIEAGKLLVKEILYNTKDNTNLINAI